MIPETQRRDTGHADKRDFSSAFRRCQYSLRPRRVAVHRPRLDGQSHAVQRLGQAGFGSALAGGGPPRRAGGVPAGLLMDAAGTVPLYDGGQLLLLQDA